MGKQLDKSNLGYLDIDFQYKLAKIFVEDHSFFSDVCSIVNQNAFTDQLLRTFVGIVKDYYEKYGTVPSYDIIKIQLNAKSNSELEKEEWDGLVNKIKNGTSLEGYDIVKENALKFFKQQNLIKVANKILEIAGKGDIDRYDECQKLLDDASLAGQEDEFGFSPFDLEEQALSPIYTVKIPTGISKLDQALNGGLAKKKVGVIIGSSGFGKTTLSTSIASYASTFACDMNNNEGFKVLQIYFEDDNVDMVRKHFSKITQVESKDLTVNVQQIQEIREVLEHYQDRDKMANNLRLKPFMAHDKSASDIGLFIKKLINTGWKPDLVIIDYFECLAPEKGGFSSDSQWAREANTMRRLENIAKELDIAIWVPTQGNKDSILSTDLVTMDKAGGSIVKVQAASVIISIARSVEQQKDNIATLALIKNRGGSLGVWKNIKFNNGTSTISCDDVIEYDDTMAYKEEEDRIKERNRIDLTRRIVEINRNGK